MSFWLLHVGIVLVVGLVLSIVSYLSGVPVYYAYVFTAAMLVVQAIDLDHFMGDTGQLFRGAQAMSDKEYYLNYQTDPSRPFHHILIYQVGSCLLLGLWVGWTIHLKMDGLL